MKPSRAHAVDAAAGAVGAQPPLGLREHRLPDGQRRIARGVVAQRGDRGVLRPAPQQREREALDGVLLVGVVAVAAVERDGILGEPLTLVEPPAEDRARRLQHEHAPAVVGPAALGGHPREPVQLRVDRVEIAGLERVAQLDRAGPEHRGEIGAARREAEHLLDRGPAGGGALGRPVDQRGRGEQRHERVGVVQPARHRDAVVEQRLAARLVGHGIQPQPEPGRRTRAQRAVVRRQDVEGVLQQRDRVRVDRAVALDLREPDRRAGVDLRRAAAPRRGGDRAEAPPRGLDVARGERGGGERERRLEALRRRGLGAQLERLQRSGVVARLLGVRLERGRLARRLERQRPRRLRVGAAAGGRQRVVGRVRGGRLPARLERLLQHGCDGRVQPRAQRGRQLAVDRVAHDRVGEAEAAGRVGPRLDEPPGERGLQRLRDVLAAEPADARDPRDRERAADDAGDREHLARGGLERLEPAPDDLADALRDERGHLRTVAAQRAALGEQPDQLAQEERVAGGALVQRAHRRRARRRRRAA